MRGEDYEGEAAGSSMTKVKGDETVMVDVLYCCSRIVSFRCLSTMSSQMKVSIDVEKLPKLNECGWQKRQT